MNLFELTVALMNIPSVSGDERKVGDFLAQTLTNLGWQVELQPVSENQNNVIAWLNETPRVFLSTHMDTVPPFIAPAEDGEKIYGRGACDAKGIIAAQICAAEELRRQGITDIGLLYTVDEEQSSTGAKAANLHPLSARCRFLINGEPTDNDLAVGSKGAFRVLIKTKGRAAHSAYPEYGESAIEKLLDILQDVRKVDFPGDDFFGQTTCNIGTINAGLKINIVPADAEAGLLVRLTTPRAQVQEILERIVVGRGELEVMSCSEPVRMLLVDGFEQKVVRFTTDIPHLPDWGRPLLLGPGSILVAHTKDEFILKKDLEAAVDLYISLVKNLLGRQ
jgi:acetylornithine deacetylase